MTDEEKVSGLMVAVVGRLIGMNRAVLSKLDLQLAIMVETLRPLIKRLAEKEGIHVPDAGTPAKDEPGVEATPQDGSAEA